MRKLLLSLSRGRINTIMIEQLSTPNLMRLLQLSSAALPVGAYAFSQAMESAVEANWLTSSDQCHDWLLLQMQESIAVTDLPLLKRQFFALADNDIKAMCYWNAYTLACRETSELQLTETATGQALIRLLDQLGINHPVLEKLEQPCSFILAHALASYHWSIPKEYAYQGYLWSWLENQVAAATKLVPLGQTAAQQLLAELITYADDVINVADNISDDDIGNAMQQLAIASCWHETQYSRLFRS